jgi:hypothetical protein
MAWHGMMMKWVSCLSGVIRARDRPVQTEKGVMSEPVSTRTALSTRQTRGSDVRRGEEQAEGET